jgi:hypothetical protein
MKKVITSYDLKTKVVGLSADNTNANFRGLCRRVNKNVLTKIKYKLNINIIGFGCNAHTCIIHNFAKTTLNSMLLDIRVLVTKSFGYLQIYQVRV